MKTEMNENTESRLSLAPKRQLPLLQINITPAKSRSEFLEDLKGRTGEGWWGAEGKALWAMLRIRVSAEMRCCPLCSVKRPPSCLVETDGSGVRAAQMHWG